MGRKPKGDIAMTSAERQKAFRERAKKNNASKDELIKELMAKLDDSQKAIQ